MKSRTLLVCALLGCLLCSCRKPVDRFEFRYAPTHAADTFVFRYDMLLDEPQTSYSTYIACRCKASAIKGKHIPLLISVTSPSGEKALERVDFPLTADCPGVEVKRSGGLVDIMWPYRDRIVPGADTGLWQLAVKPLEESAARNIYGIGLSYRRELQ